MGSSSRRSAQASNRKSSGSCRGVLPSAAGLNSNSADGYEGMTLGLEWTGQNAKIDGVEPQTRKATGRFFVWI